MFSGTGPLYQILSHWIVTSTDHTQHSKTFFRNGHFTSININKDISGKPLLTARNLYSKKK